MKTALCASVILASGISCMAAPEITPAPAPAEIQVDFPLSKESRDKWHAMQKVFFNRVVEQHTERDAADEQFGMIYELRDMVKDRWVQGYGLDTTHKSAWFIKSCTELTLQTGDATYMNWATQYPVQFFKNVLLHGDRWWPKEYLGFISYCWDDGDSYFCDRKFRLKPDGPEEIVYNQPINRIIPMGSIHQAANVTGGLHAYWQVTHDPEIAQGTLNLADLWIRWRNANPEKRWAKPRLDMEFGTGLPNQGEKDIFVAAYPWHCIAPTLLFVSDMTGRADLKQMVQADAKFPFDPTRALQSYGGEEPITMYRGLVHKKTQWSSNGADPYGTYISSAQLPLLIQDPVVARKQKCRVVTDRFLQSRMARFCAGENKGFHLGCYGNIVNGVPKLIKTEQARTIHQYIEDIEALAYLREDPTLYSSDFEKANRDGSFVRFTNNAPVVDGAADDVYKSRGLKIKDGNATITSVSTPFALYLYVESADAVTLTLDTNEDTFGTTADRYELTVADGKVQLLDVGQSRKDITSTMTVAATSGSAKAMEIRLPYVLTGKSEFRSNGFEKAPWRVWLNGDASGQPLKLFFLSDDEYVRQELRAEFQEGLNYWIEVFETIGFLPFHYDGPKWREIYNTGSDSRGWSDLGGYSHFISAVANYEITFGEGRKYKTVATK